MRILLGTWLVILACGVVDALSYPLPQNGWYSCNQDTHANSLSRKSKTLSAEDQLLYGAIRGSKSILGNIVQPLAAKSNSYSVGTVQCAQFTLPLCHTGICDSNNNIDVFVKRRLASNQNSTPKALWLLQGGPGASTAGAMETIMAKVYEAFGGTVDIYTMDHRGTGRSHRLECTAAQVETSGSPSSGEITPEVLSACIQDINIQLGPSPNNSILSAFSTTSAALDVSTLITNSNNTNTYVYGVSYGTYLVERLMLLNNTNIKGYILDGVMPHSGSGEKNKLVYSDWEENFYLVAGNFLSLCSEDEKCSKKFQSLDLSSSILKMYENLNSATYESVNDCQKPFFKFARSIEKMVPKTRSLFGYMVRQRELRGFIPVLVYRFLRCSKDDSIAIYNFIVQFETILDIVDESDYLKSDMLYLLIMTSELWRFSSETTQTLSAPYASVLVSSGFDSVLQLVCIANGAKHPSCRSLVKPSNNYTLQYPQDQYYDKPVTIPTQSSVLMLSGLLDTQTPAKYARYQNESFIGTEKRLIEFNYSAHGTVLNSARDGACAVSLITSYIRENGNLNAIDASCKLIAVDASCELNAMNASCTLQKDYPYYIPYGLGVTMLGGSLTSSGTDMYELSPLGFYVEPSHLASFGNKICESQKYQTAMIIGFVLAGVLLIIVIVQCVLRHRQQKKSTPEEGPVLTPVAKF